MNITLSWDLFIVVFFAIVTTYTFIIGKRESVKIMLSCYVAIVAVQGVGNLLQRLLSPSSALNVAGITADPVLLSTVKLVLFIAIIVLLTVKAGLTVQYTRESSTVITGVITGLFGFATSALLLSTLLTYASNLPLLDTKMPTVQSLSPIIQQSQLMQVLIYNQDVWFALPAVLLIVVGFLSNK